MANNTHILTAGDLFNFEVTPTDSTGAVYDLTVGTWQCKVGVYDTADAEIVSKIVTDLNTANTSFSAYFTESETALFPETVGLSTLTLSAQIRRIDTTPVLSIERTADLIVNPQRLSNA